ncbi:MAG: serine/threonine protein kinase, partial [Chitinophagaceae bacterium]|nr:serine/threonine protein kinase [Rubrivivax sp.]
MANRFGIDAPTWARLNPLLEEALDLGPAERAAWLQALPALHDDLKDTLADLLSRSGGVETGALLATMPKLEDEDHGAPLHDSRHAAGDVIGPYRLLRELGMGGMGAVWLADRIDGLMQRSVALKLPFVPIHGPYRDDLAARIAREREIVATLDHPNIARLHDAGIASDGQPYLALEVVNGQRIDRYCQAQQLDVLARLRLFRQAAGAVAYAHSQLVVHRDIKPSNLLVDAQGQVKLLDFGIAKLLAADLRDRPALTQQGMRVLTPDYASPEQIAGLPVGTRSDVYSLGVLLFELLTGTRPYGSRRKSRAALEEAVLTTEAPRTSDAAADPARRRALRGDIDTIVGKALKKPPGERYASVDALIDDIERHLSSRPVLARPDRLGYRVRKFVVRYRIAVGVAAALMLTVCIGAGAALWQARIAIDERQRAEAVKDFVTSIFREAGPYEGGSKDLSAVALLKQADKRLAATFVGRSEVRVELSNTIGASLLQLGDFEAAEPIVQRAVAEAEQTLPALHPQAVRALYLRSQVHRARGRPQQARDDVDRVLPMLRLRAGGHAGARTP